MQQDYFLGTMTSIMIIIIIQICTPEAKNSDDNIHTVTFVRRNLMHDGKNKTQYRRKSMKPEYFIDAQEVLIPNRFLFFTKSAKLH